MIWVLLAIGSVLIVEGLALALAPLRIEQVMAFFARLSRDQRRVTGLVSIALGVVVLAMARALGG
jgi:uncharacterized protein YjeT (DUF2065 family)